MTKLNLRIDYGHRSNFMVELSSSEIHSLQGPAPERRRAWAKIIRANWKRLWPAFNKPDKRFNVWSSGTRLASIQSKYGTFGFSANKDGTLEFAHEFVEAADLAAGRKKVRP